MDTSLQSAGQAASSTASLMARAAPIHWRDRVVLWTVLAALVAIAWAYLFWMPMEQADFGAVGKRLFSTMTPGTTEALLMFAMWAVMMVAMMLPSAGPMVDTFARIARARDATAAKLQIPAFVAGYLIIWTLFSVIATAAQLLLQRSGVVNPALTAVPVLDAVLLILAGLYQLTPFKNRCLTGCRSPLGFLMTDWRDGARGALKMGLRHGLFCLGCCSMLMLLLFVFGVMNLAWVAILSIFVLLEKALPGGRFLARAGGIAMLAGGIALLL